MFDLQSHFTTNDLHMLLLASKYTCICMYVHKYYICTHGIFWVFIKLFNVHICIQVLYFCIIQKIDRLKFQPHYNPVMNGQ